VNCTWKRKKRMWFWNCFSKSSKKEKPFISKCISISNSNMNFPQHSY